MTLHWWMHWFWITYHLCVCACDMMTRINNNFTTTTMPTLNGSDKSVGKFIYIPPIPISLVAGYSNSTFFTPVKLHKTPKKHESTNSTNRTVVITEETPLVKEMTVIDQNFTETDLNIIAENQTFINTTNRLGNTSYLSSDSVINQNADASSTSVNDKSENKHKGSLSAAGITGITLGCISIIGIICVISFIIYRNYEVNRPQVLNDRCSNPDSSGYIDDSTVRENSEEMYSLDNDSFLNSLEAMTIQNLWTDTVKHTKL